ncbi:MULTISPECIES: GntR family transcriptional regulator [unclassified Streptomyces]|uniref:GntR family transcriptional regulator n=1 Tax=unclassified Streptomyces TaxID=2593676 RepID=UPI00244363AA|nr:GntR family transcriptional regulator [Streptomyces sp. DH41]MDG9722740.1 GntR family transcriptional regulator [Streptomyces sp. DH41]
MPHLTSQTISVQTHLRDQVADALRAALIAGELRPGVVYSAPALAAELGVSATPVREAMLDLAREGLVEAVRNKGFRITEMTDQDLDEFTEIRTLIEVPIVGRVAGTASAEQLEALRPLAREIVTAARKQDILKYLEADHRFHLELLSLAGNQHLVEVVADLRKRSRLYGLGHLNESGHLVASAQEHVELLDLMVAGRVREAEDCMRRHLAHIRTLWAGGSADGSATGSADGSTGAERGGRSPGTGER